MCRRRLSCTLSSRRGRRPREPPPPGAAPGCRGCRPTWMPSPDRAVTQRRPQPRRPNPGGARAAGRVHCGAMELPADLTARPLTMDDARAVYEVMAADEQEDLGRVEIEEADIVADWQRPSFDVSAGTVGVFDGERLVAYAEVSSGWRADAAV